MKHSMSILHLNLRIYIVVCCIWFYHFNGLVIYLQKKTHIRTHSHIAGCHLVISFVSNVNVYVFFTQSIFRRRFSCRQFSCAKWFSFFFGKLFDMCASCAIRDFNSLVSHSPCGLKTWLEPSSLCDDKPEIWYALTICD